MQSYLAVRTLTPEEETVFPLLLRGAALRFLLTRSRDWVFRSPDAQINLKDPLEYAAKLRFFQQTKNQGNYGG